MEYAMSERLFKFLQPHGLSPFAGGRWPLPEGDTPGEWLPPVEGRLVPCKNGFHLCRYQDLTEWIGPILYEAEYRGQRLDHSNKVVVREARLLRLVGVIDDRMLRYFAADCAEHVLYLFERERPNDDRPRLAIAAARDFSNGNISAAARA